MTDDYSYRPMDEELDAVAIETVRRLIDEDLENERLEGEFKVEDYVSALNTLGHTKYPKSTLRDRLIARVRAGELTKRTSPSGGTFYKKTAVSLDEDDYL